MILRASGICLLAIAGCVAPRQDPAPPRPEPAHALVDRADDLRRRGRWDDAERAYLEALERDPASLRARAGLQVIGLGRGRHLALRREHRGGPEPYLEGRLEGSKDLQREAYSRAAEPYRSLGLGSVAASEGDLRRARRDYETALAHDAGLSWGRVALGRLLLAGGALGEAEACFLAALWSEPCHPTPPAGLSLIADRRGDIAGAVDWALEAFRRAPDEAGLVKRLERVARRSGSVTLMRRAAQALEGHGAEGDGVALLVAAGLRGRLGELVRAEQDWREAGRRGVAEAEVQAQRTGLATPPLQGFVRAFARGVRARYRHYAATGEAQEFGEFVAWAHATFERETGTELADPAEPLEFSFVGKLIDPTEEGEDPLVRACAARGLLLVLGQRAGGPPEALLATIVRREPLRRVSVRGTQVEREVVWIGARHLAGYLEWAGRGDLAGLALARVVVIDLHAAVGWEGSLERRLRRMEPYRAEILAEAALDDEPVGALEDPAGVSDRLYLSGELDFSKEVYVHENAHLVDVARHLPVMDHPLRNLGLAVSRGFSPTEIEAFLERNAQLTAIAEGPAPLAALGTCCAGMGHRGPHASGYREIVSGFVEEIRDRPEDHPEVDPGRVIVQQLHRLPAERVRAIARLLMERWDLSG